MLSIFDLYSVDSASSVIGSAAAAVSWIPHISPLYSMYSFGVAFLPARACTSCEF